MKKKKLKEKIEEKELQIQQFKMRLESSDLCEEQYNKAILEKAILKKELEEMDKNNVVEIIKKILPKKKTRICDYFKNGKKL